MAGTNLTLPRRGLLGGLAGLGGLTLTGCSADTPPTYGNLLRAGDNFTYYAQRLLLPRGLAPEFSHSDITSMPAIGNTDPGNGGLAGFDAAHGETYARLRSGGFEDWRLSVEGRVARPGLYSLADLKRLPARTQITKHTCEEGWSSIAQWTGAPLRALLEAAGILPDARWVNLYAFDAATGTIDMVDALHPQTLLAYGMNGRDLPISHGAPVRLRVETQLGYNNVKFLRRIVVLDRFDDMGKDGLIQAGWSWYAGI